jgi:TatA/E family protein of Tat protein translocase
MFGIGMPELLMILALALIVIGPKKLPDVAKSLGRGLGEFRRATQEIKNTINVESYNEQLNDGQSAGETVTAKKAEPAEVKNSA